MSAAALHGFLDPFVMDKFVDMKLETKQIQAEYVWIGGTGMDLRSKCRTLDEPVDDPKDLPDWNYDGSSTEQASGDASEIIIKPRAIFKDPFRGGKNILVMCDTYWPDGTPHPTNTRHPAAEIFEAAKDFETWFGVEQEWTMFSTDKHPFGWPKGGFPGPQGPYYCGVGADKAFGRPLVEAHYKACMYAGVKIAGCNGEVMAGQWEYQCGICHGIEIGDHLWMSRYILHRLSEYFNVTVSFEPKPIDGDWNGAGCHTNYSTKKMREKDGYKEILAAVEKLGAKHHEHIAVYGLGNERRLTGKHETASMEEFSSGVGDRGASVRIPTQTEKDQRGYLEDRRPAANMDPYVVGSKIVETTCL